MISDFTSTKFHRTVLTSREGVLPLLSTMTAHFDFAADSSSGLSAIVFSNRVSFTIPDSLESPKDGHRAWIGVVRVGDSTLIDRNCWYAATAERASGFDWDPKFSPPAGSFDMILVRPRGDPATPEGRITFVQHGGSSFGVNHDLSHLGSAAAFPPAASHPLNELLANPSIAGSSDGHLSLNLTIGGERIQFDGSLPTSHPDVHAALMELLRAANAPGVKRRGASEEEKQQLPTLFPSTAAEAKQTFAAGARGGAKAAASAASSTRPGSDSGGASASKAEGAAAESESAAEHVELVRITPGQPGWLEREEELLREVQARGDPATELVPAGTHDSTEEYVSIAMRAEDEVLKDANVSVVLSKKTGFDIVRYGNVGPRNDIAFFHSRSEEATSQRLALAHYAAEILEEVCSVFAFNAYYATLFYQRHSVSRFLTGLGNVGKGQGLLINIWPIEQKFGECGGETAALTREQVRSEPFCWCYLYGLCIHKLAHFHYVNHGTVHDFFMDELRIEYSEAWIELLLARGFDPAQLCTSEISHTLMFTVVN